MLRTPVDGLLQPLARLPSNFWALMKRSVNETFHHLSGKHLGRYVDEFNGRHNLRELDTEDQMAELVRATDWKRLKCDDLIVEPETRDSAIVGIADLLRSAS